MSGTFGAALAEWNAFFAAVAGVAATLVGLLFVALGLNPAIMADDSPAGLRVWAGQTFHNFLVVLVLALIALIPGDNRQTLLYTFVIVGIQGIVRVYADFRRAWSDPDPDWGGWHAVGRYVSPLLAYLVSLWLAWQVWMGETHSLGWIVAVIFLLLMSAAGNCWDLLKAIGDTHRQRSAPE